MTQCGIYNNHAYEAIYTTANILYNLGIWALLFVVLYTLNSMLRRQLGSPGRIVTGIPLAVCGIVLALTIVYLGLVSYTWLNRAYNYDISSDSLVHPTQRLVLALRAIYLFSVMLSFALSAMNISALRRARLPGGDLVGWVVVLHVCMFIWALLAVVWTGMSIFTYDWALEASLAVMYVTAFFRTISFVVLLGIAKHVCWRNKVPAQQVYAPVMHRQGEHGYNGEEHNYYQAPPEIFHAK
ncbi:hypothetical protein ACJQWK_06245 [Exserohilum turcicum]